MLIHQGLRAHSINDIMQQVCTTFYQDIICIAEFKHYNRSIHMKELINRSSFGFDETKFIYDELHGLLSIQDNRIMPTSDLDQRFIMLDERINPVFSQEILIPFYDYTKSLRGFVYFATNNYFNLEIESNIEFFYLTGLLINTIENEMALSMRNENLFEMIYLLIDVIHSKDSSLISNIYAVSYWCKAIASQMKLPDKDIRKLQLSALLHDLGKIFIDDSILRKQGNLTESEFAIIRKRVDYSYTIVQRISSVYLLEDIPEIILHYQERIDGTGYPQGLSGDNIPQLSKILCVAKAIASMLSNTLYRQARTIDQVIIELKNNSGTQFDVDVAESAIYLLIYKNELISDYLSDIGSFSIICFQLRSNDSFSLEGTIHKKDGNYIFRPMKQIANFDLCQIIKCNLYLNTNERIIRLKPTIDAITHNEIVISNIDLITEEESFSIKWSLAGTITTETDITYEILTTLIGGEYLDFYIHKITFSEAFTKGTIRIKFSSNEDTLLHGIVVYQQLLGNKVYIRFKYTNVSETINRTVFTAIFRRQLEVRKLIKDTKFINTLSHH
ncbi:MAG: HD domain-containing protein [Lachnospiraceae bacterium]|nr:HD domain-containing protein [Lachnospiraceae bacterium]